MTHKLNATVHCSFPIHRPLTYSPIKLYSLFRKDISGRWIQISDSAYSEKLAYRVFTERLLINPLIHSIRPVKVVSLGAK